MKMASCEYRKQWHKYLPLAKLNYNTSYHTSVGCVPPKMFLGRVPYRKLQRNLGLKFDPILKVTTDFADKLLRRTQTLYDKTKKNVMQSNVIYKNYYDKKSRASPLQEKRLLL